MCFFCYDITASSVADFAPTILKELGWAAAKAQLMTMPIWGIGFVSSFTISVIASRTNFLTPFLLVTICFQLVRWGIMKAYPPSAGI
jgi:cyanate permease